eukprot:1734253-Rhodomonas_salina.1
MHGRTGRREKDNQAHWHQGLMFSSPGHDFTGTGPGSEVRVTVRGPRPGPQTRATGPQSGNSVC